MTRSLKGLAFMAAFAGLAPGAAAQAQTPVTFQLNWVAGGANAGFAAALQQGYYKDAGLDVTIVQGNGSGTTAQLVASGRADIAYADAVAVNQLIAKGAPMKVVATLYQSSPSEVNALSSAGIGSIKDLAGKKVGIPAGSSQAAILPLFLEANGLKESDMQLIAMPPTAMVPSLLQGQVDAILGSMDAYRPALEKQGAEVVGYAFADFGVPTVSTSVFASDEFAAENGDVVRKFIAASLKGWGFAVDNPEKAVADLKTTFPDVNVDLATRELASIKPLLCAGGAKFVGKAEDAQWTLTQDLLAKVALLPEGQDPKSYYTHEFLPPEGELRACPL